MMMEKSLSCWTLSTISSNLVASLCMNNIIGPENFFVVYIFPALNPIQREIFQYFSMVAKTW